MVQRRIGATPICDATVAWASSCGSSTTGNRERLFALPRSNVRLALPGSMVTKTSVVSRSSATHDDRHVEQMFVAPKPQRCLPLRLHSTAT
jgi:hypothetical protein